MNEYVIRIESDCALTEQLVIAETLENAIEKAKEEYGEGLYIDVSKNYPVIDSIMYELRIA